MGIINVQHILDSFTLFDAFLEDILNYKMPYQFI